MGGRIMVVDEDGVLRGVLAELLESRGYCVRECSSIGEVVSVAEGPDRPDLVVVNLDLPLVDGEHLWGRLRGCEDFAAIALFGFSGATRNLGQAVVGAAEEVSRHRARFEPPIEAGSEPTR